MKLIQLQLQLLLEPLLQGLSKLFLIFVLLSVVSGVIRPAMAQVICEQTDDNIVITLDGRHVLTYHKTVQLPDGAHPKYARSGFIHTILTPSGRNVIDGYPPPNHTHHNGVFFSWRSAIYEDQKMNFWEPGDQGVRHEKVLEIYNDDASAGFKVQLAHYSDTRTILHETWTVLVHADTGYIDLTSEQRCATNSPLTIEKFHYGGMAIRGAREWLKADRSSFQMLTNEGLNRGNGNHSRPSWACMSGLVNGEMAFVAMIPHPTNFRYPQPVRLHHFLPYFCFVPMLDSSFQIQPGQPLTSRYRIVAGDGEPNIQKLDEVQRVYALEK